MEIKNRIRSRINHSLFSKNLRMSWDSFLEFVEFFLDLFWRLPILWDKSFFDESDCWFWQYFLVDLTKGRVEVWKSESVSLIPPLYENGRNAANSWLCLSRNSCDLRFLFLRSSFVRSTSDEAALFSNELESLTLFSLDFALSKKIVD